MMFFHNRISLHAFYFFLRRFLPRWVIATLLTIFSGFVVAGMVWIVFVYGVVVVILELIVAILLLILFAGLVSFFSELLPKE